MSNLLRKENLIHILLGFILILHSLILSKLIFFPYPELFVYPYLTNIGLKPYNQILDQHFPGLMFFPINLNNLGMVTPEAARAWSIIIVVITQILIFLISKEIFKSGRIAVLTNLLYLIWQPFFEGWVFWIDSFLPLFLLPAFYYLYKKKIFLTGLFVGVGIVFKQVLIPLSGLIFLYLIWETKNIKKMSSYLLGLFLILTLMIVYLISIGVLKDFWYWTIYFNLTTFAESGAKTIVSTSLISRVALVYGVSILALFSEGKQFYGLFSKHKRLILLLFIFLLGSLVGSFDRTEFIHFQPSLPFAILTTVIGFNTLWKKKIIKLIILGYCLIGIWWLNVFYKGHLSNQILFFDNPTKIVASKIKQYTKSGDKIFIFGAPGHLYQMSNTRPTGDIFVFQFPWFLQIAGNRILGGIKYDQPEIIVSDRTVEIDGLKITDFAKNIDQYIEQNYKIIDQVGTISIMRKKTL